MLAYARIYEITYLTQNHASTICQPLVNRYMKKKKETNYEIK